MTKLKNIPAGAKYYCPTFKEIYTMKEKLVKERNLRGKGGSILSTNIEVEVKKGEDGIYYEV